MVASHITNLREGLSEQWSPPTMDEMTQINPQCYKIIRRDGHFVNLIKMHQSVRENEHLSST